MRIDAHVHFWKYEKKKDSWITDRMKILQQDYLPQTIEASFRRNGIDGCVAVQANQSELETLFLVELSKTHEVIKAVVGWVDLKKENIEERLQYFSQFPIIKGWRHVLQSEPIEFFADAGFRRGLSLLSSHNYTYDLLVYANQLRPAVDLVSNFPENKFILDHCGKPDIAHKKLDEWKSLIGELAAHPNVYCKLSGLIIEADWKHWSPADIYPFLDVVFEAFGTERLVFASDWPVMLLAGIYVQWKSLVEKYMENFTREEAENVFGLNAESFYVL